MTLQKQKAEASHNEYEAYKSKFKAPPVTPTSAPEVAQTYGSNPTYKSAKAYTAPSYDDIHEQRRVAFRGWNPPVVVYQARPSYGSWDSSFLWWMLYNDSSFGYHHRYDPGYLAWRQDALRLSEQNGELKAKLAEQDANIARLEGQQVARNESYLPQAVAGNAVVALSDDAIATIQIQKPLLRVATGVEGGRYNQIGNALKQKVSDKFDVELVVTSGSDENLRLLKNRSVDAAIVQSDTDYVVKELPYTEKDDGSGPKLLGATVYSEYVMLLTSKDSPVQSVKDLGKDNKVYIGPNGSGTAITWKGLADENPELETVQTEMTSYESALDRIKTDPSALMLFVAGAHAPIIDRAASTGAFKLIPVQNDNLTKVVNDAGHPIYDSLAISPDTYPGLQIGSTLKTLAVDAMWTLSEDWVKKFGETAFDRLNYAVIGVISDLHIKGLNGKAKPALLAIASPASHASSGHSFVFHLFVITGILVAVAVLWWFIFRFNAIK